MPHPTLEHPVLRNYQTTAKYFSNSSESTLSFVQVNDVYFQFPVA